MQAYWTLARRELGAYFLSLTGYVIIAAAVFLMGFSMFDVLQELQRQPAFTPITELLYNTVWVIVLPTTPLITMRLFAQEKFSGTFETLMTTPVTDLEVVLAKFTAALLFYTITWLPMLGCILVVRHYTSDPTALDPGVVAGMFLGILLLGGLFVALGCLASALTRTQATAAMISLVFGLSLFLLAVLADRFAEATQWQAQVLACFTLFDQTRDFARGVIDTRAVVLYTSLTLLLLFLTLRVVESRRWK
jgi:ABC-2 type transport system permease protein